jgi:hypothetical protein
MPASVTAPPAPQHRACLEVLYQATIAARMLGYEGHENGLSAAKADQLADLMDAVHNLPRLLIDWSGCNESLLRGMLDDYDTKWSGHLLEIYDRIVAEGALAH